MLHVVTTGAYYPPVVTTWKILNTGASQLTAGSLCNAIHCHDDDDCDVDDVYSDDGDDDSDAFAEQRHANRTTSKSQLL